MKKEGYRVDFIPEDTESFIKTLTAHATNDISMLTDKQVEECNKNFSKAYIDFFATFPESVKRQMEKDWEEAPGKVMLDDYWFPELWTAIFLLPFRRLAAMGWILPRFIMILM